jgi:hypothetical protein
MRPGGVGRLALRPLASRRYRVLAFLPYVRRGDRTARFRSHLRLRRGGGDRCSRMQYPHLQR